MFTYIATKRSVRVGGGGGGRCIFKAFMYLSLGEI